MVLGNYDFSNVFYSYWVVVIYPLNLKFKVTVSNQQEIPTEKSEVNEKKCDNETYKVKESMSYFVIFNLYLDPYIW